MKRIIMAVNLTGESPSINYYISGKRTSEVKFHSTIKKEAMARRLAIAKTQSTGFGYRILWARDSES